MRIRTFTADSARDAIELVRAEMGPHAIIIALDQAANGRGAVVRAAMDDAELAPQAIQPALSEAPVSAPSLEHRLEHLLRTRLRAWSAGLSPQQA